MKKFLFSWKTLSFLFLLLFLFILEPISVHAANSDSVYNGVDYSSVYDKGYYLKYNPDIKKTIGNNSSALIRHFVLYGMKEGRQASNEFNVKYYMKKYPNLVKYYGSSDLSKFYIHYVKYGKKEGRIGASPTIYNQVDYSSVYNYSYYKTYNSTLQKHFGNYAYLYIRHFVLYGMKEGRQASNEFNVKYYMKKYPNLVKYYGSSDLSKFYIHYVKYGKKEGRIGASPTIYNKVDYKLVYNYDYYSSKLPVLIKLYGNNKSLYVRHFVLYGMKSGLLGSYDFDPYFYKSQYSDLSELYSDDMKSYYIHFIKYGYKEGRKGISDSVYQGVDYSDVYNFTFYANKYPDLVAYYGTNNPRTLIKHFVLYGMNDGLQGSAQFDLAVYKANYPDLVSLYKDNNIKYYTHYLNYGKSEGRLASDTGWSTYGNNTYYYSNGSLVTGWLTLNERKYYFNEDGILSSKFGIDVSHWQGTIDWEAALDDGIEFAIIRIGYGDDLESQDDTRYAYNISECERLNIPYGIYFYSYATTQTMVNSEVAHTLRLLKGTDPELGVFYDMEDSSTISAGYTSLNNFAYSYMTQIKAAGYKAGLYANTWWLTTILTDERLQAFPIWVAQYSDNCTYANDYIMWQYSSEGILDGVRGYTDFNILFD